MATETGATPSVPAEIREGEYGDRVVAVEPGGAEFIPLDERHGRPLSLFWTWMSPNLEFATVFVGVLAVVAFGQTFWQAALAIVLGTGLGSLSHGLLGTRGPLVRRPADDPVPDPVRVPGQHPAGRASTRSPPASAGSRSTA